MTKPKGLSVLENKDSDLVGIYVHVPFCDGKCPYCDFYSLRGSGADMDRYVSAVKRSMAEWGERLAGKKADTLYFGGGTPSVLGGKRLSELAKAALECFDFAGGSEITAEVNPGVHEDGFFGIIAEPGFNRISVGIQSFCEDELKLLGRRHSVGDGVNTVTAAVKAGIKNVSVDLMINLPGQTLEKMAESVRRAAELNPAHISVYMLKNEPGTPFGSIPPMDGDEAAEQYETMCDILERSGFVQYEISNFARPGFESRHNLKYWRCGEYLGIGPSAHGFINGRRFFYPRDMEAFENGCAPEDEGEGGTESEKIMTGLRLSEGIPADFPGLCGKEDKYIAAGFMKKENGRLSFTRKGFLVSNSILADLI